MEEKTKIFNNKPKTLNFNTWEEIKLKAPNESTVVAWLDNELKIDAVDKFDEYFKDKEVMLTQRLRIFNETAELHVWRSEGKLKGRLRQDKETSEADYEETEYIDADQLLWGTRVKTEGDYLVLSEVRGTQLTIPNFIGDIVNEDSRIFIKTRNYIGFTHAHHATYVDSRFVEFDVENQKQEQL